MAKYRVHYFEYQLGDRRGGLPSYIAGDAEPYRGTGAYPGTGWQDEVEARSPEEALEAFFRERGIPAERIRWVLDGQSHPFNGWEYDPRRQYIWIEDDGRLMQYRGVEELEAGVTTCPLCHGRGQVDAEVASEFEAVWFEEEEMWEGGRN
jgi:hypothetical protein